MCFVAKIIGLFVALHPQVRLPNPRIVSKRGRRTIDGDAACFQDVSVIGQLEGYQHVLFDEQDGQTGAIDLPQDLRDPLDDPRREAQ